MANKKTLYVFIVLLLPLSLVLFAEESLPQGYANVKLGMSLDSVKNELKKDSQFGYRGDRDVSLLPGDARVLIETDTKINAPYSFLERCWFQFYDEKLYIVTINVNPQKMDYYSIFKTLCEKYGNPDSLNPEKSEWKNDSVILSLERPLTLKYTDKAVFDKLQNDSQVKQTSEEDSRDKFLQGL